MKNILSKKNNLTFHIFNQVKTFCSKREVLETDILIVGGGPAGLSTAIKLAQLAKEKSKQIDITLIEKGEEIGSHILSGCCFESKVLNELIPDWKTKNPPFDTEVSEDSFKILLNKEKAISIPNFFFPKSLSNHGNHIISLSQLTRWLATQAEELGVNIFPGFSAKSLYLSEDKKVVKGVYTNDFGISKKGEKKDNFELGNLLTAKQVILAEGCRGSISEQIIEMFNLRGDRHQHYGLGLKEVWEVDLEKNKDFKPGLVQHTVLWPLDSKTYSGSFMYHMKPNLIQIGYVVGLDYKNPYINPYEEFQKFKTHKEVKKYLENARCIEYGARALNEGGFYSLPKLTFPGGLIVGCSAGMLNVAKIKGTHNAIKSGIIAAKAIFDEFDNLENKNEIIKYQEEFNKSEIYKELYLTRNTHGAFSYGGLFFGMFQTFISNLIGGKEFWKFIPRGKDSEKLLPKEKFSKKVYDKKDGKLTFDLLENLSRSGTNHNHDQPIHLQVKDDKVPLISLNKYDAPEERFCPAKVYEFVPDESTKKMKLQINAQNCLHCKCCSIKMINEYINWTVPEGKGGPKYNLL